MPKTRLQSAVNTSFSTEFNTDIGSVVKFLNLTLHVDMLQCCHSSTTEGLNNFEILRS